MCLFVKRRCEVEMIGVSWERNKCMERVTLKRLENGVGEWWILRAHKTRVRCTLQGMVYGDHGVNLFFPPCRLLLMVQRWFLW